LIVGKELLHSATRESEERIPAHVHRNDDPLVFLTAIASEFTELYTASEHASKQYLAVFTSSPTSQAATSTTPMLVFGSEDVRAKEVGEALKGVKGRITTGFWIAETDGSVSKYKSWRQLAKGRSETLWTRTGETEKTTVIHGRFRLSSHSSLPSIT
jgi:hypothetical protein